MDRERIKALRQKYEFGWDILDVIIGGKSSLDAREGFQFKTREDAAGYLEGYGYDADNPIQLSELFGNFREALSFVRTHFLRPENPQGLKLEVPRKLVELTDVRDLFLMGSYAYANQTRDPNGKVLQYFAVAVLKVMHAISHMDQDLRTPYFGEVQKSIFDRFYKFVHRDDAGQLYMGLTASDPTRVNLVKFETKPKKSRESTLLKLLHKPENVAEDIFDRVGLRFVTRTRLEALQVIRFLLLNRVFMPSNIKPSRSRNTLIDVEDFRKCLRPTFEEFIAGEIDEPTLIMKLEEAAHPPVAAGDNPHSSEFYRAIQFTCRQLIKHVNPIYDDLRELKLKAKQSLEEGDIKRIIERIELKHLPKEVRFFYPYEVQIMDLKSFEDNERGRSAHSEYRKSQVQAAMKRIMGSLAD